MLSDHPLSVSGVGVQSRYLINGLLSTNKYSFRCFGGALKHESMETITVNSDFVIKPTNGFGDKNMLRQALVEVKPDALLLFTDPRFFIWVWEMEDEVHQVCPIVYNHIWDNPPWPEYNRVLYESTDYLNCINHPIYEMVSQRFPEKSSYIPHAVPPDLFYPLTPDAQAKNRVALYGPSRADHFIVLFVSRNAMRKSPGDIIVGFKMFLDELEKKEGHRKATLVMHTDPLDQEGPNLHHIIDVFGVKENVFFSRDRIGFNEMNLLYNSVDAVIQVSRNEGFGLSLLEAKMAEKPIISSMTGGCTRQVLDHETGEEYGAALKPDARMLVGNQLTPYIYEDVCSHETISNGIMKVYNLGPTGRAVLGKKARQHAMKHYNMNHLISEWDRTLEDTINKWKSGLLPNNKRWAVKEL
jgi:glycosyltransferase involved in cell wall biosynthesis